MRLLNIYLNKEVIVLELNRIDMGKEEKDKLLEVLEELAEYRFINVLLQKLEEKDKQLFIQQLHDGSAEIFVEFLREKVKNVEDILTKEAKILEQEIIDDIRSLRK